jgi:large subunit ribosomal protein L16
MSLLSPNRRKFRKQRRWRNEWSTQAGSDVAFGSFGMKAVTNAYISSRQIEAARKVIVRYTRKTGKIWIRIFPDLPYTKKWLEMPMGSGKWEVDHFQVRVKRGKILFEVSGIDRTFAEECFKQASYKLPLSTRLVERNEIR